MTDASKVLDDAKYSGTKEVDESLKIDAANLQPWIDAYIPSAGKISAIEQFKGGQSNPTYKTRYWLSLLMLIMVSNFEIMPFIIDLCIDKK